MLAVALVFSVGYAFGQTAFWDAKEPRNYSDSEKLQIMTDSPWAKVVRSGSKIPGPAATGGIFDSSTNGLGRELSPVAMRTQHPLPTPSPAPEPQPDSKHPLAFYGQVTILWETASPIRELTETALPDAFVNHVIGVKGLPALVLKQRGALSPEASLSAGKHRLQAEFVALTGDESTLLLAFPLFHPEITASDKSIVFAMKLTGIKLAAKFEPKKMICRGRLML